MTETDDTAVNQSRDQDNVQDPMAFRRYLISGRLSLIALAEALTVAEFHNIRRAAAALSIMPSAVSTRIKTLEETLGYPLFDRRHGIRPTLQGHVFLDFAERALSLLAQAMNIDGNSRRSGALRIALQSSATSGPQASLLQQFSLSRPDVFLIPKEVPPRDLAGSLRKRSLDVALTPWAPDNSDIILSFPLWREHMMVVLSDNDPLVDQDILTREDLAGRTFLVRSEGIGASLMERVLPWLTEGSQAPKIEELHAGRDTLLLSVAKNHALAFVMPSVRDLHVPGVVYRSLDGGPTNMTFHAVWSRYNNSPALHAFLKTATSVFGPEDGPVLPPDS
ncbi:LysR family transcriptional regulator [Gluconobacter japonicus]|uniref:LysR family transcriptional regulator n=1 Tax=Gluconobacter japonicus TaxID=376620 RepID=UPI000783C210|nr:LysR family transcriptional regulator [Gluconobacter japonicus]KXV22950.1 hypothetical protein AD935_02000 [Gluconobacter japonicus]